MASPSVDLVLCVDCSASMRPCFAELRANLKALVQPMQQGGVRSIRYALVCYSASKRADATVYRIHFVGGNHPHLIGKLYSGQASATDYFTSDPERVTAVLDTLTAQGDEDSLMALDIAADLPFGPVSTTQRVVALFTDEPLENGVSGTTPIARMPQLVQKIHARRIQLFVAAPYSEALAELGTIDRAEIEAVNGGDGLRSVDFAKLLSQMGKSISVASLQSGAEPVRHPPLFGQEKFVPMESVEFTGE